MVLRNLESSSQYILHRYISRKVGTPTLRKLKNAVVNKLIPVFFLDLKYHPHFERVIEVMEKVGDFTE